MSSKKSCHRSNFVNKPSACKDRGWFIDYTPFESFAGSIYLADQKMPVAGVGTVVLPVKKSPNRSGPGAHGHLVLHDVIHCPSAICNIIGYTATTAAQYTISFDPAKLGKSKGTIKDRDGRSVAYFAPNKRLFQVKLSGPPVGPVVGPSALGNGVFVLNIHWSDLERARWEAYKQRGAGSVPTEQPKKGTVEDQPKKSRVQGQPKNNKIQHPQPSAPYTTHEKQWLKAHYGNEYHFLQTFGLSIFKDDDREEGRDIVRQFMKEES